MLGCIDVGVLPALEKKCRHVAGQEAPRLRIHYIQAVMVDEHRLLLRPVCPALLAGFLNYPRANRSGEWSLFEPGAGLAAPGACDVSHFQLRAYSI